MKEEKNDSDERPATKNDIHPEEQEEQINLKQFDREPVKWDENVTGVKTSFQTEHKEMAFNACSGHFGK